MSWFPIVVSGWLVCSVAAALLIGRGIGLADERERERLDLPVERIPRPREARPLVTRARGGAVAPPRTGHGPPPQR